MRSNCLIFAVVQYFRHGGYIIVRRSRYRWVPHFIWAPPGGLDKATVRHYVPVRPGVGRPWQVWRAVLFRGRVRTCDRPHCGCEAGRDCDA